MSVRAIRIEEGSVPRPNRVSKEGDGAHATRHEWRASAAGPPRHESAPSPTLDQIVSLWLDDRRAWQAERSHLLEYIRELHGECTALRSELREALAALPRTAVRRGTPDAESSGPHQASHRPPMSPAVASDAPGVVGDLAQLFASGPLAAPPPGANEAVEFVPQVLPDASPPAEDEPRWAQELRAAAALPDVVDVLSIEAAELGAALQAHLSSGSRAGQAVK